MAKSSARKLRPIQKSTDRLGIPLGGSAKGNPFVDPKISSSGGRGRRPQKSVGNTVKPGGAAPPKFGKRIKNRFSKDAGGYC